MARARGSRAAEVGRLRGVSRETSVARDNVVIGIHRRGRGGRARNPWDGRGGKGCEINVRRLVYRQQSHAKSRGAHPRSERCLFMSRCPSPRMSPWITFPVSRLIDFIYLRVSPFVAPLPPKTPPPECPPFFFLLSTDLLLLLRCCLLLFFSSSLFLKTHSRYPITSSPNPPRDDEDFEGGLVEGIVAGLITSLVDKTLVDTVLRTRPVEESSWMGEERARNPTRVIVGGGAEWVERRGYTGFERPGILFLGNTTLCYEAAWRGVTFTTIHRCLFPPEETYHFYAGHNSKLGSRCIPNYPSTESLSITMIFIPSLCRVLFPRPNFRHRVSVYRGFMEKKKKKKKGLTAIRAG